jgi:hypothetical protein
VSQLRSESQDSSLNIVTELRAGGMENICTISDLDRLFLVSFIVQTGSTCDYDNFDRFAWKRYCKAYT